MERNKKFKKFSDRTSKGNEKKEKIKCIKNVMGCCSSASVCSSYVRAATGTLTWPSTLLTDLTLQESRQPRLTKKKKIQLRYCENATKFSLLQKIILF